MTNDVRNRVLCGDALGILKTLANESVNCIVTSPPYYGLRFYNLPDIVWDDPGNCEHVWENEKKVWHGDRGKGTHKEVYCDMSEQKSCHSFCSLCGAWRGSLGNEPNFKLYISHLMQIFTEVRRVLKKDGCLFVNLGDSFASSNMYPKVKPKSLLGIPERFVIAMTDAGWVRRNTIVWYKPNCIPSSARDRFTVDFEYIYFFTKSGKYWFERQFEAHLHPEHINGENYGRLSEHNIFSSKEGNHSIKFGTKWSPKERAYNPLGRNMRTVWKIPSQPYKESHFATYPEELVRRCIKAGCPEHICTKCGKVREKVFDNSERINTRPGNNILHSKSGKEIDPNKELHKSELSKYRQQIIYRQDGYSQCSCGAPFVPGIVLDPFAGSGTTGAVAKSMNRDYILIEPNPEYIKLIEKRLQNTATQLTVEL